MLERQIESYKARTFCPDGVNKALKTLFASEYAADETLVENAPHLRPRRGAAANTVSVGTNTTPAPPAPNSIANAAATSSSSSSSSSSSTASSSDAPPAAAAAPPPPLLSNQFQSASANAEQIAVQQNTAAFPAPIAAAAVAPAASGFVPVSAVPYALVQLAGTDGQLVPVPFELNAMHLPAGPLPVPVPVPVHAYSVQPVFVQVSQWPPAFNNSQLLLQNLVAPGALPVSSNQHSTSSTSSSTSSSSSQKLLASPTVGESRAVRAVASSRKRHASKARASRKARSRTRRATPMRALLGRKRPAAKCGASPAAAAAASSRHFGRIVAQALEL